jgi:hypothetical protein
MAIADKTEAKRGKMGALAGNSQAAALQPNDKYHRGGRGRAYQAHSLRSHRMKEASGRRPKKNPLARVSTYIGVTRVGPAPLIT